MQDGVWEAEVAACRFGTVRCMLPGSAQKGAARRQRHAEMCLEQMCLAQMCLAQRGGLQHDLPVPEQPMYSSARCLLKAVGWHPASQLVMSWRGLALQCGSRQGDLSVVKLALLTLLNVDLQVPWKSLSRPTVPSGARSSSAVTNDHRPLSALVFSDVNQQCVCRCPGGGGPVHVQSPHQPCERAPAGGLLQPACQLL